MTSPEISIVAAANTELYYTAIIEAAIKQELGSVPIMGPLMRYKDLSGEPSGAWSVPQWPLLAISAAVTNDQTDITMTAINTTETTCTAAEYGFATDVSDKFLVRNVRGAEGFMADLGQYLGRIAARNVDRAACALFSSASWTTSRGTTNTDLDTFDFLGGIVDLETQNAGGPIVAVLPPVGAHDLRQAITLVGNIGTTTANTPVAGSVQGSNALAAINSNFTPNQIGAMQGGSGLWANLYNVPVYITTQCPTSGNDSIGWMGIAGSAIGIAVKYLGRVELDRNASLRNTEVIIVSDFGVKELDVNQGVKILVQTAK